MHSLITQLSGQNKQPADCLSAKSQAIILVETLNAPPHTHQNVGLSVRKQGVQDTAVALFHYHTCIYFLDTSVGLEINILLRKNKGSTSINVAYYSFPPTPGPVEILTPDIRQEG